MWSSLDVSGVARVGVVLEVCDEAAEHGAREELAPVGPRLGRGARDDGRLGLAGAGPCLLYTSPSPRDGLLSRMPSSA